MRALGLALVLAAAPAAGKEEGATAVKFAGVDAKTGCNPEQRAAIERALLGGKGFVGARARALTARQRLDNSAPLCPALPEPAVAGARPACETARALFGPAVLKFDLLARLAGIEKALSESPDIHCAPRKDPDCGSRKGYVRGETVAGIFIAESVIWVCPRFFSKAADDDARAQALLHEAAHVAGVADAGPEAYCLTFDCQTPCGGVERSPRSADTWAQLADCLSGSSPRAQDEYKVIGNPR